MNTLGITGPSQEAGERVFFAHSPAFISAFICAFSSAFSYLISFFAQPAIMLWKHTWETFIGLILENFHKAYPSFPCMSHLFGGLCTKTFFFFPLFSAIFPPESLFCRRSRLGWGLYKKSAISSPLFSLKSGNKITLFVYSSNSLSYIGCFR